jgi:DNA-binding IclR family transcriptional regulator
MSEAAASIAETLATDDADFSAVIVDDAKKTIAAISLVIAQSNISSELIDNLNASIHVRALLTDLFLLSETLS